MAPSMVDPDDCVSVYSYCSSRFDEEDEDGPSTEEPFNQNEFEEKLLQAMESTFMKAAKVRISALEAIRKAFSSRYFSDFITERRCSISDIIERCMKKGKGEEQGCAALLAALVCISMGPGEETDAIFSELEGTMITALMDKSVSTSVRAHFATSIGLCSFIAGVSPENIRHIMECLYSLFSASFHKASGVVPNHGVDLSVLHNAALLSWALLLSIQSAGNVSTLADKHLSHLIQLLDSSDVELRISAGETIAVIFEICGEYKPQLFQNDLLFNKLRQLATDSQKFRAKKERRKQRSSFRDVLKFIEDDELPSFTVRFGREKLSINTWCKKIQYDAFCHILGSGMNRHLAQNELLRDIFGLGAILPTDLPIDKSQKNERKLENMASSKARTKSRGKLRDKRTAVHDTC